MAKWLKITIISILIALILGVSAWFIFFSGYLDKSKRYTYNDLMDMYDAGYAEGTKNTASLQTRISALEVQITVNNARITELQTQLSEANQRNEIIPDLEQQIDYLETINDTLEFQVITLTTQVESLTEENSVIPDLRQSISELETLSEQLSTEIERLKAELEIYNNNVEEMVYIDFYNENQLHRTVAIRKNGSILIDIEVPTKDGYDFVGWTINNEVVDITVYVFIEDVDLYAKFEQSKITDGMYSLDFTANYINSINWQDNIERHDFVSLMLMFEDGELKNVYCFGSLQGSTVTNISFSKVAKNEYEIFFRPKNAERDLSITIQFNSSVVHDNDGYYAIDHNQFWYYKVSDILANLDSSIGVATTYTNVSFCLAPSEG